MKTVSSHQSLSKSFDVSAKVMLNNHLVDIHSAKFKVIFEQMIPLTLLYKDTRGLKIQLWKTSTSFLATVIDSLNDIRIIPSTMIRNALNPSQQSKDLLKRIESIPLRKWALVYNPKRLELTIWPLMMAAAQEGEVDKYKKSSTWNDLNAAKKESTIGEPVKRKNMINREYLNGAKPESTKQFNRNTNSTRVPFSHITEVRETQSGLLKLIKDRKNKLDDPKLSSEKREQYKLELKAASKRLDRSERFLPRGRVGKGEAAFFREIERVKDHNQRMTRVFIKTYPPTTPGKNQFYAMLKQTGLIKSYNSCNRDSPAPTKGGECKEIGGVGCSVEPIENLFDSPESLFETAHAFFIPAFEGTDVPFTNQELGQILYELAMGIYVHQTVPFFSLHFNQNSHLYPVIHPAYENTLVGQVFSMLDYFMKGYLNGGVFLESFVHEWQKKPYKIQASESMFQNLIDFKSYAETHLEGNDQQYVSVRIVLKLLEETNLKKIEKKISSSMALPIGEQQDPDIFSDYTKFTNSFRIIAKQKSIQKTEGLFTLDWDFDVFYTIESNPDYQQALEEYSTLHGKYPAAYQNLIRAYDLMKRQIHDHMVKMPFCRKYFAMLGLINFFSYYFMTLKKHRKFPILPSVTLQPAQCPAIFPSLPILNNRQEDLKVNYASVIKELYKKEQLLLTDFLLKKASADQSAQIEKITVDLIWQEIYLLASGPLKRQLGLNKDIYLKFCESIKSQLLESLHMVFVQFQEKDKIDLAQHPEEEIISQLCDKMIPSIFSNYKPQIRMVHRFIEQGLSVLDKDIALKSIPAPLFSLPAEQTQEEMEMGEKVVGGCGMVVLPLKVDTSSHAHKILDQVWNDVQTTPYGQLSFVKSRNPGDPQGTVFSLSFDHIPLTLEEYPEEMEILLTNSLDACSCTLKISKVLRTIASGNHEKFMRLILNQSWQKMIDREGRTLLHHSVTVEDLYFTNVLISKIPADSQDHKQYLPLHYASMHGHISQIKILLSNNPKTVNACSNQGATPLIVAIQNGRYDAAEYLLHNGAQGNVKLIGGYTSLHCAVLEGSESLVRLLIEQSIDVYIGINASTNEGITPLMLACQNGSLSLVQYLISKGADPKLMAKNGLSPLEIAVKANNLELTRLLVSQSILTPRAIDSAIKKCSFEINQLLSNLPGYLHYRNALGDTPLLLAIRYANIPVARHLLDLIKDVDQLNVKNKIKESPIELVVKGKFYDLLKDFLKRGIQINLKYLYKLLLKSGYQGENAYLEKFFSSVEFALSDINELLMVAVEAGNHVAITNLLIPRGADLNLVQSRNGWHIEHFLAKSDGIFLFKFRYQGISDPLLRLMKEGGKTTAYIAAENGSWRILKFLLGIFKNHQISLENHYQDRHLFYAVVERGELEGIQLFLDTVKNSELLHKPLDKAGTLPVHLAAKLGFKDVLEDWNKLEVNYHLADASGYYPLYYAIRSQSQDAVKFLLDEKRATITAESIFLAATLEKDEIFQLLIKSNANLDDNSNFQEETALSLAIKNHHLKAFLRLIHHGVSLTTKDREGWTPLLLASREGEVEMLEEILSRKEESGIRDFQQEKKAGQTALHVACQRGHEHCAKVLIRRGFLTTEKDDEGKTPMALKGQSYSLFAILSIKPFKDKYQKIEEDLSSIIKHQNLALILENVQSWPMNTFFSINFQCKNIRGTILHLLLITCANCSEMNELVTRICKMRDFDPNLKDGEGNSYAHHLVNSNIDVTKFSLFSLMDVNHDGQTPLHYAASNENIHCLTGLIKELGKHQLDPIDKDGRTPLILAILKNKREHVKLLAAAGASLEHPDYRGITPLIYACIQGDYFIVRMLVKLGANINQRGRSGLLTPLSTSLELKNEVISLFLLSNGAKINQVDVQGNSIGHIAALRGKVFILRFLAEQGCSLSNTNDLGFQPIHMSAMSGKISTLAYLVSQGISIETPIVDIVKNEKKRQENSSDDERNMYEGMTPLHLASQHGSGKAVNWLLEHRANPEQKTLIGLNALSHALNSPDIRQELLQTFTDYRFVEDREHILPALAIAIRHDNVASLKTLYEMGIPIDSQLGNGGWTGLHFACHHGALHCTEFFLTQGANCNVISESGVTPLELSAANKNPEQFRLMLIQTDSDLDINRQNQKDENLIHIATKVGNLTHVALLIDQGADFDAQNAQGQTPLFIASEKGFEKIVSLLMIAGANSDLKTYFSALTPEKIANDEIKEMIIRIRRTILEAPSESTPLHIAAKINHPLALRVALRHFNVDQKNTIGRTALHEAAGQGNLANIRILLSCGANVNEQDRNGRTCLGVACLESRNLEVIAFLLKAGGDSELKEANGLNLIEIVQQLPENSQILGLLLN